MAMRRQLVIIPDNDQVLVLNHSDSVSELDEDATTGSRVDAGVTVARSELSSWLANQQLQGSDCTIALYSHDCLFARFPMPESKAKLGHREMTYLAEACLPMSAEDMAAVFWRMDTNSSVMACRHSFVVPLIQLLQSTGLQIISVVPAVIAAIHGVSGNSHRPSVHAIAADGTNDFLRCGEKGEILEWVYDGHFELKGSISESSSPSSADNGNETQTIHWTLADVAQGATSEKPSPVVESCDLLQDPRLSVFAHSQTLRPINSWCLAITIGLAIVSAGLMWRISSLRSVQHSLMDEEDRIVAEVLQELPETRRNVRQLDAKLARLTKWETAVSKLRVPDAADQAVGDILKRSVAAKLLIRSVLVKDEAVTLSLKVPEGVAEESVVASVKQMGLSTDQMSSTIKGTAREISFQFPTDAVEESDREK